jgi:carbonic anhydrase
MTQVSARDAIAELRGGNARFVADSPREDQMPSSVRRRTLVAAQAPFAVVLSCSDARVPAELIFDQGLGSLFVVRVAGNVVAPSLVGSVEYAVQSFGIELVVVMGHTGCGAIQATLNALMQPGGIESDNLLDIVQRVRPSVEAFMGLAHDRDALLALATRANIRASAEHLRRGSRMLEQRIAEQRLAIVGAEYTLTSGVVDFFDDPHRAARNAASSTSVLRG